MSSLRRSTVLIVSALLALSPAAPALGQSAGDEQYSDPLAGQGSSEPSAPSSGGDEPSLTQQPQGSGSSGSGSPGSGSSGSGSGSSGSGSSGSGSADTGSAGTSTPTTAPPTGSTRGELPRTGLDTGTIAALGLALLALGIGLRLRTADARF